MANFLVTLFRHSLLVAFAYGCSYLDGIQYFRALSDMLTGRPDLWYRLGRATLVLVMALCTPVFLRGLYQWWYREWLAWKAYQSQITRLPESTREGSPYSTVTPPKWVCGVYGLIDDRKIFLGTGWATSGYIVTAGHVVNNDYKDIVIKAPVGWVSIPKSDWNVIGPDVAVTKNRASWGLPEVKINAINGSHFVTVYSACESQNSSMGVLKHTPDVAYGSTEYSGSTRNGFSGSPYYNGHRVLGMHVGGGNTNYGYSSSYIMTLLARVRRQESSDLEQIREALRTARMKDVEVYRGIDETEVRVGGNYFIIDNEEMDQLYEDEEFDRLLYEYDEDKPRRRRLTKRQREYLDEPDYEPECNKSVDSSTQTEVRGISVGVQAGQDVQEIEVQTEKVFPEPPVQTRKGLSTTGVEASTSCQPTNITQIHAMLIDQAEIMRGLQEQVRKLSVASVSTPEDEPRQMQASGLSKVLSTIMPSLLSPQLMGSDSINPPCPENQILIVGSGSSSPPSTQLVPLESETTSNTPQSAKRWDTMDSDLRKLREWRNSKDVSSPDYGYLRNQFLSQLGLDADQKAALVARLKNTLLKQKQRARKANARVQTQ